VDNYLSGNTLVGIATGYGLDGRGSTPDRISLHHTVQTGSGAHPASYSMDALVSILDGKAVGGAKLTLISF
jgi:hypothetical protein